MQRSWINPNYAKLFATKLPNFQPDVESLPSPAPVKGWDAISPLSNMPPDYAVILDNTVPKPSWDELRGGCAVWAQGLVSGPIESLMAYRPQSGSEVLFAAGGGDIWDATVQFAPVISLTGLAGNRWQYINFTPAGNVMHLVAVNGQDTGKMYNGSWANFTVTGVDTANIININIHKRRIWLIEGNSTSAWFLATDAIAGTATEFELGPLITKGGTLVAMGTWTIDGGAGPDDYAIFMTSEGQAIIYKGTDPANTNAWALVGVFDMPPPIGRRCFTKYGSDLLFISLEGVIPLSKALPFDPSGVRSISLTNRIQNAMLDAAQAGRSLFGWQITPFPLQGLLVVNVPITESVSQVQFVMSALTGAWCRFTGWNANCFETFNKSLYFGDNDGNLNLAYAGGADITQPIQMDIKTAFNYYDSPGRIKVMQLARPFIVAGGRVTPTLGADVDFGEADLASTITVFGPTGGVWDDAIWDTDLWSTNRQTNVEWQSVGALGTAISLRIKCGFLGGSQVEADLITNSVFDTGTFDTAVFDGAGIFTASGQGIPVFQLNQFQVVLEHGAVVD